MRAKSSYKMQPNLSFVQLFPEIHGFIPMLVMCFSANRMDFFENLLHTVMVTILSSEPPKGLRYEY